jgi:hypothetical protein
MCHRIRCHQRDRPRREHPARQDQLPERCEQGNTSHTRSDRKGGDPYEWPNKPLALRCLPNGVSLFVTNPTFIPGLELSRYFYFEAVAPLLAKHYPDLIQWDPARYARHSLRAGLEH